MTFTGFTAEDFETFHIEGLEPRMQAIRERIQPKFQAIGAVLADELAMLAGRELFVHIAKHARRKTNAPNDTWMAFCHNKKGYKMHPHFQIGLFDDHVFLWLALIYELPGKKEIAAHLLEHRNAFKRAVPKSFMLSFDHMRKEAVRMGSLSDEQLEQALTRFRDVLKAELLVGRQIPAGDPVLQDGEQFLRFAKDTLAQLMPLYKRVSAAIR